MSVGFGITPARQPGASDQNGEFKVGPIEGRPDDCFHFHHSIARCRVKFLFCRFCTLFHLPLVNLGLEVIPESGLPRCAIFGNDKPGCLL